MLKTTQKVMYYDDKDYSLGNILLAEQIENLV